MYHGSNHSGASGWRKVVAGPLGYSVSDSGPCVSRPFYFQREDATLEKKIFLTGPVCGAVNSYFQDPFSLPLI